MDLLSGLRKGGSSRGGRAEFSWDSVKEDKDRENYLGHSLMAPVGRWQKGKNLTWYAEGSDKKDAADERAEEIRRIKEAEQDALAEALGFAVNRRHHDPVDQKEVQRAIRESGVGGGDEEETGSELPMKQEEVEIIGQHERRMGVRMGDANGKMTGDITGAVEARHRAETAGRRAGEADTTEAVLAADAAIDMTTTEIRGDIVIAAQVAVGETRDEMIVTVRGTTNDDEAVADQGALDGTIGVKNRSFSIIFYTC
ncbi:hypothetical protein EX30DRAFT_395273 [Ascodesmis nigricans]|uniref:Multiple myeloma tumor-associated protein 2-like N-terminal domain-containing protein n=1 Tax=Ascodesmis nigricans TaxID=341454 RepID=A0A4S2MYN8_9PEZI|nr:hypothetical protein EX30DRAFT_395273 [Ascodesmis nigricans]